MARLSELTWVEYAERIRNDVVILPVGATEQHGYHLPLGTDTYQVVAVAEAVAERVDALVAPALCYGYKSHPRSGGGEAFPGSTGLDAETLITAVRNVLAQLLDDGARRLMVLSGHFENRMILHEAIDLALRGRKDEAAIMNVLWADFLSEEVIGRFYPAKFPGLALEHAALLETSVMLYLYPDLVRLDRLAPTELATFPPYDLYPEHLMQVPPSGSLAPSEGASVDIGREVVEVCVDGLVDAIRKSFRPWW